MAKRKKTSRKISKLLFGELVVLILILLLLPYSNTLMHQGRNNDATASLKVAGISTDTIPTPAQPENQIPQASGRQMKVPILMYHYIGNNPNPADTARDNLSVSPEKFDDQMGYLAKAGYSPVTLDTMIAGLNSQITLSEKSIVLTFDDGYMDFYYNAFPILQKYGFRSVVFIPTGLVGRDSYLTWDQISKMQSGGLVSFQAHSVNHVHLPSLSHDQIIYELAESKKTLESRFGIPVNFVAYPYGASNSDVTNDVKSVGYIGALGTWNSNIQSEGTIYNMPRIKVSGTWDINQFATAI